MRGIAWIAALLAVLTTSAAVAAKIYKWSDAQGQTHYGGLPPIGRPAQALDIQTPPGQPRPAASGLAATAATPMSANGQAGAGDQSESDRHAQPTSQDTQPPHPSCEVARQNLHYLQGSPSNRRFRDPSGQVVRYTETQLQAKITATEHYLEQHCPAQ
jgi:hypothetical protein